MAVATIGGDVWVVSGVDDDLLDLRWKRFAAGLYEPFGVTVVDGLVYVTCKDRLVRLHDRDGDGEADFYESFSADDDVSTYYHAFNFDLQTDGRRQLLLRQERAVHGLPPARGGGEDRPRRGDPGGVRDRLPHPQTAWARCRTAG